MSEETTQTFRQAMRRLAGGVALITTELNGRRYGMPMTAVMSLTIDPPAIAVGVNRSASISIPLLERRAFCVNLLHQEHEDMCGRFSGLSSDDRFSVGSWSEVDGIPYLEDAQSAIFCDVGPVMNFGTHQLVIGLVTKILLTDDINPLLHVNGRYTAAMLSPHRDE